MNDAAAITHRNRIINIDETCCKILPLLERGWLIRGNQYVVMDTGRNITVFFATRQLVPDVHAQLIVRGKTSAVELVNLLIAADLLRVREFLDDDDPSLHSSHGWTAQS